MTEHITEPLRIEKVEVLQGRVFVMEQKSVLVKEFGGLAQFCTISVDVEVKITSSLCVHLARQKVYEYCNFFSQFKNSLTTS